MLISLNDRQYFQLAIAYLVHTRLETLLRDPLTLWDRQFFYVRKPALTPLLKTDKVLVFEDAPTKIAPTKNDLDLMSRVLEDWRNQDEDGEFYRPLRTERAYKLLRNFIENPRLLPWINEEILQAIKTLDKKVFNFRPPENQHIVIHSHPPGKVETSNDFLSGSLRRCGAERDLRAMKRRGIHWAKVDKFLTPMYISTFSAGHSLKTLFEFINDPDPIINFDPEVMEAVRSAPMRELTLLASLILADPELLRSRRGGFAVALRIENLASVLQNFSKSVRSTGLNPLLNLVPSLKTQLMDEARDRFFSQLDAQFPQLPRPLPSAISKEDKIRNAIGLPPYMWGFGFPAVQIPEEISIPSSWASAAMEAMERWDSLANSSPMTTDRCDRLGGGETPQQVPFPNCPNCVNFHGRNDGGNFLVCAIHPHGLRDCPDYKSKEILSREERAVLVSSLQRELVKMIIDRPLFQECFNPALLIHWEERISIYLSTFNPSRTALLALNQFRRATSEKYNLNDEGVQLQDPVRSILSVLVQFAEIDTLYLTVTVHISAYLPLP